MSPEGKLATVQAWQEAAEKVMMVGDGINDVLVLAAADLSLAVSEASDLAKTNADTLLNNGQLEVILQMLDTGRKTRRDRKSTRLNSSHVRISYAVFCLKKKK